MGPINFCGPVDLSFRMTNVAMHLLLLAYCCIYIYSFLLAIIVTTSKALVTSSDALVTSSFLFLQRVQLVSKSIQVRATRTNRPRSGRKLLSNSAVRCG